MQATTEGAQRASGAVAPSWRPMSVSGYVDAAFGEVLRELTGPEGQDVVRTAMAAGLDLGAGDVGVQISRPEVFGDRMAQIELAWSWRGAGGSARQGQATISVLRVQTGENPVTEVLVRTVVDAETAPRAAAAVHRCLDAMADLLTDPPNLRR